MTIKDAIDQIREQHTVQLHYDGTKTIGFRRTERQAGNVIKALVREWIKDGTIGVIFDAVNMRGIEA